MTIARQLKSAFDKHYNVPLEVWENFASHCEHFTCKKNHKLKEAGKADRYGYFLLRGAAGLFIWKENSYACVDLFLENNFFGDDISLATGEPSPLEIIALEECELLRINRQTIEKLKATPIGTRLFQAADQNAFIEKQKQQIELMTKNAEERYEIILNDRPGLLKRIHQKHIASYLGITTQSLSRIRKKFAEGH